MRVLRPRDTRHRQLITIHLSRSTWTLGHRECRSGLSAGFGEESCSSAGLCTGKLWLQPDILARMDCPPPSGNFLTGLDPFCTNACRVRIRHVSQGFSTLCSWLKPANLFLNKTSTDFGSRARLMKVWPVSAQLQPGLQAGPF